MLRVGLEPEKVDQRSLLRTALNIGSPSPATVSSVTRANLVALVKAGAQSSSGISNCVMV
jgi:hypothetical protein